MFKKTTVIFSLFFLAFSFISAQILGGAERCPADQILTQNLMSPSQNGEYNYFTQGIVSEAKILQAHMNRLGFNAGVVDGILGPQTDAAIKSLQSYLKTTPDGFVGPATRELINNSCSFLEESEQEETVVIQKYDDSSLKKKVDNNRSLISQLNKVVGGIDSKEDDLSDNDIDDLSDVDTGGVTNGQILSWDGSDWVPIDVGSGTDDQTINTFSLIGDDLTLEIEDDGIAAQTVDLSGYLDDTTLSDGDISAFGYIKSYSETDPVYTAWDKSTGISITESQISDLSHTVNTDAQDLTLVGNTLAVSGDPNTDVDLSGYLDDTTLSDGDISALGYIKSYSETDPVWTAAESNYGHLGQAETITANWVNTANPWATNELVSAVMVEGENISLLTNNSGYLTAITSESIEDLSDVYSSMTPTDGQVLTFDTTNGWQAESAGVGTDDQTIDTFSLVSNTLTLEIEDDGIVAQTVDLSGYLDDTTLSDGDISALGYIKSYSETDPVYTAWDKSTGISITESQISDLSHTVNTDAQDLTLVGNTLAVSGDPNTDVDLSGYLDDTTLNESQVDTFVANNGYLTSYTETDPVYIADPAFSITNAGSGLVTTATERTNWNTAYGWGDHSGTYLPLAGGTMTGDLVMTSQNISNLQSIYLANTETTSHTGTDGRLMFDNSDGLLYYEDGTWHTIITDYATNMDEHTLNIGDVVTSTLDTGHGANELYDMNQDVLTSSNVQFGDITASGGDYYSATDDDYGKYSVYGVDMDYSIGMKNNQTFGPLNGWAMTFTMNDSTGYRGFLWRHSGDSSSSGAMSLAAADGNLYVASNVSAASFTDRTPFFDGDALKEITNIKGKNGKIDHLSLPKFVQKIRKEDVFDEEGRIIGEEEIHERDLGNMVSVNVRAIQQLAEKFYGVLDVIEKLWNKVTGLEEKIQEIDMLKSELCLRNSSYTWCANSRLSVGSLISSVKPVEPEIVPKKEVVESVDGTDPGKENQGQGNNKEKENQGQGNNKEKENQGQGNN